MDLNQIQTFLAMFAAAQVILKILVELCYLIANVLGKVPDEAGPVKATWAKWTGMAFWWSGRVLSTLGGLTSNRYLVKRFVIRRIDE